MVDAGDVPLCLRDKFFHAKRLEKLRDAHLHAVAQTDAVDPRVLLKVAGEHCHRVRVVDKQRVRAHFQHVLCEVFQHGDSPQRPEDAADAKGIRDGLAQTILFRYLKIRDRTRVVSPDLYGIYHIFCASERVQPVQVGFNLHLSSYVSRYVLQHPPGVFQAYRINVMQRYLQVSDFRRQDAVAKHAFCEYRTSCAHKCYSRHNTFPSF